MYNRYWTNTNYQGECFNVGYDKRYWSRGEAWSDLCKATEHYQKLNYIVSDNSRNLWKKHHRRSHWVWYQPKLILL